MMSNWILNTNPDDYRQVTSETREEPATIGWTVDRAMRRQDRVVLYGHGSNKTFGFLGFVLTDPIRSVTDGNWWSWIEFAASRQPLSLSEAKEPEVIGGWPSLNMMHWTARAMPQRRIWSTLAARLLADSPEAQRAWDRWRTSSADDALLPSLQYAFRAYANTDGSGKLGELRLQQLVKRAWIEEGRGRLLRASDGVLLGRGLKLGSSGFADIILADTQNPRTLQVIEVKRAAKPGAKTDGVTQLANAYVPWLETRFPDWRIDPLLIALSIGHTVQADAARHGISCWEFDRG